MLTLLKEVEERSILLAQYLDESQHNDKQQNCAGLTDIAKTISILVKNNTYDWRAIVKDYTNGLTRKCQMKLPKIISLPNTFSINQFNSKTTVEPNEL